MPVRNSCKNDLFANQYHQQTIDKLGDPLVKIETCIDFAHLAAEIDHVVPRPVSKKGGRPPFPTETMVRILVLKRI
ncbi:IS5/IS1182 family transposase, partial [Arsenophonus sp. ENCA]